MQKHMTPLNIHYFFEKATCIYNLHSKFSLNKGLCQALHDTTTCQQGIVEQMYIKCSLF
jgi:hypothetical protein